jgi:hypothetical protein
MTVTPRLAFVTVGGTLAFLGLAVLGWGGFASFVSHPARIAPCGRNLSPGGRCALHSRKFEPGRTRGSRQPLGPYRLRSDRTERISARLHGSKRDLDARRGLSDSADWSPFSQGISWSRAVCTVLSAIPATWGCWSGGPLLFDRGSACCSWRSCFPRSSRGCVRRSPSCERSSAASTKAIVPVRHG